MDGKIVRLRSGGLPKKRFGDHRVVRVQGFQPLSEKVFGSREEEDRKQGARQRHGLILMPKRIPFFRSVSRNERGRGYNADSDGYSKVSINPRYVFTRASAPANSFQTTIPQIEAIIMPAWLKAKTKAG